MRTIDFSPIFRNSVGFDHLQTLVEPPLERGGNRNTYPPYNIEQLGEDGYRVTMAVAGFSDNDLDVTAKENTLIVSGKLPDREGAIYLHRGIAGRAFERHFELAEYIKVSSANLVNGLLQIELVREVPEEKKARNIAINTKVLQHSKAA